MAYADDGVRAKLSALNETQDSIVSVAQWVMFHRRHADRTAELWMQKLKESNTSKKLNLVYLANEVVQQSKARKKDDFLLAFSPIIADATAAAYKGSTQEVQLKLRRVVEVWRQRGIFENAIQEAIEKRIDDIDKSRSARSTGARLGGSLFSSTTSIPAELQPLVQPQNSISRVEATVRTLVNTANSEYAKMTDPATPVPTPPVHAARLSSLLKNLASAEGAVNDSIKARTDLIASLEKLLETNRARLTEEETITQDLATRRATTEAKKKEVEDGIMRGLKGEVFNTPLPGDAQGADSDGVNDTSPDIEALTPPAPEVETFTPTGSPKPAPSFPADDGAHGEDALDTDSYMPNPPEEQQPQKDDPAASFEHPPATNATSMSSVDALLKTLAAPPQPIQPAQSPSSSSASTDPRLKRRKMSHQATDLGDILFPGNEGSGIDSDIAAMLGAQ